MRLLVLICCFLSTFWANAQVGRDYGISFGGNVFTEIGNGESIGTSPGAFGGIFYDWGLGSERWDLEFALQYQYGQFQFENPRFRGNIQTFSLRVLPKFGTVNMAPFKVFAGLEVSKNLIIQRDLNIQVGGDPETVLVPWKELNAGFTAGLAMDLNKSTVLRLDYTTYPEAAFQSQTDYLPSYFTFGLQVRFNQILIDNRAKKDMIYNLRALNDPALSTDEITNDTLYILNYACSERMTDQLLDSLFSRHYTFSNYRLIQQEEIQDVRKTMMPRFFAVVGSLYGSMTSPAGTGIFLLDKDFELTEFPYPVQTDYFSTNLTGVCFEDPELSALVIRQFDKRLFSHFE